MLVDHVREGQWTPHSSLSRKTIKIALEEGVRALLLRKQRTLDTALLDHLYESGGDRLDRGTVIDGLPVYSYNLHWQGFGVSFRDAIERDMNDYKERDE
jgi:hypothetical protein